MNRIKGATTWKAICKLSVGMTNGGRNVEFDPTLAYIASILSSLILARLIRQHTALRLLFLPLHKTRPAPLPTLRAWEPQDTLADEADTVPVARRA